MSLPSNYKTMDSEEKKRFIEGLDFSRRRDMDILKSLMNPRIEGKMEIREFVLDTLLFSEKLSQEDMVKICVRSMRDRGGKVREKALCFLNNVNVSFDVFFEDLNSYHFNNEIVEFIYHRQKEIVNYMLQTEINADVLLKVLSITQEKERIRTLKILRSFYDRKEFTGRVIDTLLAFDVPPLDLKLFLSDLGKFDTDSSLCHHLRKILPKVKNFLDMSETEYLIDIFMKRLQKSECGDILRYLLESRVEQGRVEDIISMYDDFHYKKNIGSVDTFISEKLKNYNVEKFQKIFDDLIPYLEGRDYYNLLEIILGSTNIKELLQNIYKGSDKSRYFGYYYSYNSQLINKIRDIENSDCNLLTEFVKDVFVETYEFSDINPHLLFGHITKHIIENSVFPNVEKYSRTYDLSSKEDKINRAVVVDTLGKYSYNFDEFKNFFLDPSDLTLSAAMNNLPNYSEGLEYSVLFASCDRYIPGEYIIRNHPYLRTLGKKFCDLSYELMDCFKVEEREDIECFFTDYGEEYLPGAVYLLSSNGFITSDEIELYKNSDKMVKRSLLRGLLKSKNEALLDDMMRMYCFELIVPDSYDERYRILDILSKFQVSGIKKIGEIMVHLHNENMERSRKEQLIKECFEFIKTSIWIDSTFDIIVSSGLLQNPFSLICKDYMETVSADVFSEKFIEVNGSGPVNFSDTSYYYNWVKAMKGKYFSSVPEDLNNFFASLRMSSESSEHRRAFASFLKDIGCEE